MLWHEIMTWYRYPVYLMFDIVILDILRHNFTDLTSLYFTLFWNSNSFCYVSLTKTRHLMKKLRTRLYNLYTMLPPSDIEWADSWMNIGTVAKFFMNNNIHSALGSSIINPNCVVSKDVKSCISCINSICRAVAQKKGISWPSTSRISEKYRAIKFLVDC